MEIRGLRYFVEVVQQNNFSRAADKLCVTQPAISRSIQKLEQELEYTLLIRETDGVKMTDEGEILFNHARQILEQFDRMNDALKNRSDPLSGVLKVGLPLLSLQPTLPTSSWNLAKNSHKLNYKSLN